ncbi:hypothetical protein NMY22_g8730 [Coprinellus aureogranulatus]|nr:hypothetical protein NMY22_g8730 [Coprinellus aureogranulatus]
MSKGELLASSPRVLLESSNDPPHPAEVATVMKELSDLEGKIASARSHLQQLEEQERRRRAILSPLRRVPCEILGEIFTLCLNDASTTRDSEELLALCLVCKKWCDAARLTRGLWTGLEIEYPGAEVSLEKIKTWYSRAGSLAKSMVVQPGSHHGKSDADPTHVSGLCNGGAQSLAKILLSGISLDNLTLHLEHTGCYRQLERCLVRFDTDKAGHRNLPWDELGSLTLEIDSGWQPSPSFTRIAPVSRFKLLLPSFQVAFENDVEVRSARLSFPAIFLGNLTQFSAVHQLEDLTLHFTDSGSAYDPADDAILNAPPANRLSLPKVTSLKLKGVEYGFILLGAFDTPSLNHLEFSFCPLETPATSDEGLASDIAQAWQPFLSRCGFKIRSLRLGNMQLSETTVKALLKDEYFPLLTDLTLDGVQFPPFALFQSHWQTPERKPLFRKLEVLNLLNMEADFRLWSVYVFLGARMLDHTSGRTRITDEECPPSFKKLSVTHRKLELLEEGPVEECLTKKHLIERGIKVFIGPVHRYETAIQREE